LGDSARGDDGVGPLAVAKLVREYDLDAHILVMDAAAVGVRLLPFLTGVHHLLVIAAVRLGAPAGTLHRLEWSGTSDALHPRLPAVRPDGIELLRMLHFWVDPVPDLVLLGVEAMRPAPVSKLTGAVEGSLENVVENAASQLRRWGHRVNRRVVHEQREAVAAGG
jgi:hydrogenase maturation protease